MSVERAVMAFAGFVVLVSGLLAHYHHPYWIGLTAFVGLNLFQAAFTRFCPLAGVLKAAGLKPNVIFNQ